MYTTALTTHAIDAIQTVYIFNDTNIREVNPILKQIGKPGIMPYFFILGISEYYIANYLSHRWRKIFLSGIVIGNAFTIIHNERLGVKVAIPF